MSTVLARPGRSKKRRDLALAFAAAGVVVIAVFLGLPTLSPPAEIGRLTVRNPLAWNVEVTVGGPDLDGWMPLGAVAPEQTTGFEALLDAGPRWTFRFSSDGVPAGRISMSRGDLAGDDWKVTVPPEVGESLRSAGIEGPEGTETG